MTNTLSLGYGSSGSGTYQITNGNLVIYERLNIGNAGTGSFSQTGGSVTVGSFASTNDGLFLGVAGSGEYSLSGTGTLEVRGDSSIGISNTGTFTQSGGSFSTETLSIGVSSNGLGTFTQNGGTVTVAQNVWLGKEAGSTGAYTLSGTGSLAAGGSFYVGYEGEGSVAHSGGSATVSSDLILGYESTGVGTYNLSGTGYLEADNAFVGWAGQGTFSQTGGEVEINNFLSVGDQPASQGTYGLSGGTLTSAWAVIGNEGTGSFTQSGGEHQVTSGLYLGMDNLGNGSYQLSGTGILTAGNLNVGEKGTGTFTQTGGENHPGSLYVGHLSGGEGTYNLGGGSLSTGTVFIGDSGTGTFNQTGGDHINTQLVLGIENTGVGTYNLSGGTLETSSEVIGNLGQGTFSHSGGTHTVSGNLILGYFNTGIGTYTLSGTGTLAVDEAYIGYSGAGTFTQQGGTVTVNDVLGIALNPGSTGTYNFLGGSLTADRIQLWSGGTFKGAGTVTAPTFVNGGRVQPGTSVGKLTISGSYTQNPGGTLEIEVASATSYDQLEVTGTPGTATLAGKLKAVLLGGYVPAPNTTLKDIITATGGISGEFDTVESPVPCKLTYNLNSVDLLFLGLQPPFNYADPAFPLTANQRRLGFMFNAVNSTAAGDLRAVLDLISQLPGGRAVAEAYQQITPDKNSSLPLLSLTGTMLQWRALSNRLHYLRWGEAAPGGGLARSFGRGGRMNLSYSHLSGLMLAYNGASLSGLLGAKQEAPTGKRWGVFTDFIAAVGDQGTSANQTGYDYQVFGFNTGVDYRLRRNLLVGVASGYYHTATTFRKAGGYASVHSIPFYAYGLFQPGNFYAMGSIGYTLNLYDLSRRIRFGGLSRRARSSVTGHQFNVAGEAGYDFRVRGLVLTPVASLYYSRAWVEGHKERGAGSLSLRVEAQSADSLQTGFGVRVARPFRVGNARVVPQGLAFYQHEFANHSRGLDARLSQAGTNFSYTTASPARDFAVLGGGVAVGLKKNLLAQVNYNAEVGRGTATNHFINAGLRLEF